MQNIKKCNIQNEKVQVTKCKVHNAECIMQHATSEHCKKNATCATQSVKHKTEMENSSCNIYIETGNPYNAKRKTQNTNAKHKM